ncbi:sensor histidine kinase [Nannocystis radixulma]|uniref:histidine kinase n=1 Tax=Nannocystis radixulma TaxID=2995305 RepID=A0ABT5BHK0_9BACT|nr:HAMP domain-containing sensor histidine kinase [Nannocystis radixulma]MDC0673572.1 HAMP domain-containing sensor histidine kinase [Nannocystis radixulma]
MLAGVVLVAPGEHRLTAIVVGAILVGGHLAAAVFLGHDAGSRARVGAIVWSSLVAVTAIVGPSVAGATTPIWCLLLPIVAVSVHATSTATGITAIVLGFAAGAGLFIAGAGTIAWLATAGVAGVGLLTAVAQRRGEGRDDALRRRENELAGVRTELRDLRGQHVAGAEGRIVALTRANQALQSEVERGRRVLEEALDASRTKTSFLLKISHELRTPLNAIVGYTELLLEHPDESEPEELQSDLTRILGAAHELLALIDSVLDLARLEAGKFELHIEEFALHDLVHECVAAVTPLADRGGNKLKLKLSRELGTIRSDRTRLRQVLVQLLGNACKFTHGGLVELRVEPMTLPTGAVYLLSVRDTGVGIDPAYLPRLFTPFSQADDSPTRRFGGLGVGLALCRHYCTLLGGEISAESELGKGTVFRVQVPATARDPRDAGVMVSAF